MKSNNKTNTLTFKLWLYFIAFAILLFLLLWFMQVIMLQSYYSSMKKNEIAKLSTEVESDYLANNTESIDKIAFKNACSIYVFDLDGDIKYMSTQPGDISNSLDGNTGNVQIPSRNYNISIQEAITRINSSQNKKISYTIKLDRFKSEIYVYGRLIPNTNICVLIISPIDPIDATTKVLQSQLVYVTIIALIISSIVSIFISKRISSPLKSMRKNANKLAQGNYDIIFEKAGYKELDDLADTLNFATKRLAETDKVRKELIANVSHDLKTPLTMIKAYSEMIRDLSGDNKEKRNEHLQVIIDETDRLTRLVSDMMDLSKIELGITDLTKTVFDLSKVVKKIVDGFDIIKYQNCSIKLDIPKEAYVLADKTKIEQVLYNLISNAINHSLDDKKIEIKISNNLKRVKCEIKDNGPGIAKEDLKNIWNRYYRTSNTYKRATNGSGLGLSIVKNILDKHNSNYGVNSELNKGSTFYFDLEKASKKAK